jgi:hypothetical protein
VLGVSCPSLRVLRLRAASVALLTSAALTFIPSSAAAHTTEGHATSATRAHAHEHEIVAYWQSKFRAMSPARRQAWRSRALTQPPRRAAPSSARGSRRARRLDDQLVGPASVFGAWTSAPFKAPTYGIHAMVLPTGRVLLMSMGVGHGAGRAGSYVGQDVNNDGAAAIWDPERGTGTDAFRFIAPPPTPLDDPQRRRGADRPRPAPVYCSGHVQLADGRILIAGGNLEGAAGGYGLKLSFVFDPWTERWLRQPDLVMARWYPTLTRMPDGRVAIIAGRDESGINRPEIEFYPADGQAIPGIDTSSAPAAGTTVATLRGLPSYYPHAYVMRSGKLAIVGPTRGDQGVLDLSALTWTDTLGFRQGANGYGTSFLAPNTTAGPDRVIALGGLSTNGFLQPLVSSLRPGIDHRWTDEPGLKLARRNAPAVLLPDGSVVAIGGAQKELRTVDAANLWPTRRQPELWDPISHQWRLGPAQQRPRGYHSSALLLPDGRVMSIGDDLDSLLFDDDLTDAYDTTIELYSPPYLFKGPRPVLTHAPRTGTYDQPFTVTVQGDASAIERVTVVAPGSNTHALDMNQRHLDLRIVSRIGNEVTVLAPPTPAAAPPGPYLLFALSAQGVPSVGRFVQLLPDGASGQPVDAAAPTWDVATPTPTATAAPSPTATPTPTPTPSGPTPTPTPSGPTPTGEPTPTSTATPTPTPTATPSVTPTPTKSPRPWWWPWFMPWTG